MGWDGRALRTRLGVTLAVLAVVAGGPPASAHHGWGSYDAARPLTLIGPIGAVSYENPHVAVRLEASGRIWEVILAPVSRMVNRGATADLLAVGTTVTVYGYPSRVHENEVRAERITIADRTIELR